MEEGKLVGILSDSDLRNVSLTSERIAGPGEPQVRDRHVREVMIQEVWSLTPEDSVEDALLIIQRKKFGALPVLAADRLVVLLRLDTVNGPMVRGALRAKKFHVLDPGTDSL